MGRNSEETKLVATWMHRDLLTLIDSVRWQLKRNRSQFIREAVAEKLARQGLSVPPHLIYGGDDVDDPVDLDDIEPLKAAESPDAAQIPNAKSKKRVTYKQKRRKDSKG